MVLGLSGKNRIGASVQVDYLIHIQEIKPWPPSQSLRSLRAVLIQWESGDRSHGSTNTVVPSLGSIVGEGKIEFNESFRLPVTLIKEMSVKGNDTGTFQKNCIEFNLHEPRRDKTQVLATAVIDLADFGVVKEAISVSAPMNSKRSFSNSFQPVLHVKIQPVEKRRTSSMSRNSLSKAVLLDKNGAESVSTLMSEEYAEEAEVSSFTDDDISSHSSLTNGGLPSQIEENGSDKLTGNKEELNRENAIASKVGIDKDAASQESPKGTSSCLSSAKLSTDLERPVNIHASVLNTPELNSKSIIVNNASPSVHLLSSLIASESEEEKANVQGVSEKFGSATSNEFQVNEEADGRDWRVGKNSLMKIAANGDNCKSYVDGMNGKKCQENEQVTKNLEEDAHSLEDEPVKSLPQDVAGNESSLCRGPLSSSGEIGKTAKNDRSKNVKSVRSPLDSVRSNGLVSRNQPNEMKEVSALGDAQNSGHLRVAKRISAKIYRKDARTTLLDGKIQKLEHRIKMLEGELREAAAIEAALYSVVAEHGSSMGKVHAPARRLSRLYLNTYRESSQSRRASAARSAVSGLVLVAKACGNDVSRLTFWLSNSVVLRAIISQAISDPQTSLSAGLHTGRHGSAKVNKMASSSLKWKDLSTSKRDNKNLIYGDFGNWEDPNTFTYALERVEAWIFSRAIESIWWQTLTPHMQSAATKAIDRFIGSNSKKKLGRTSSSCDQDQGNFSLSLWKKAFKDASERLCPVRAGGHECGCLPVLARVIMEQCVARLDVAMFNAILRESADEIPTDPVSDPISDLKVLPIPAGKSSFGAGAQLKNAIGNWLRWLTDLFGMDDDDSLEDDNDKEENAERQDASFKSFHLLNAFSDLLMLPKDMLLSKSIRKEVCPAFSTPLIKRILDNFVSDEFSPDPIPHVVLEALDSEDTPEVGEDTITTVPCVATPPIYLPPSAASVAGIIGEPGTQCQLRRSRSSVIRKSYTSDDELEELSSPFASIFLDGSQSSPALTKPTWKRKENAKENAIRYELLKDIWMNCE